MTSSKLIAFWIIGGLLLLFGSWIMHNLQIGPGVSELQYTFALLLALVLFLLAGLAWISVAAATRQA